MARIAGQQVTQQRLPSSPYPDQSVVRLSIRYPHPGGKSGFALAEMVVETRTPPNAKVKKAVWQQWSDSFAAAARDILPGVKLSDGVYEAWALDISKSDLDRVIQGMSLGGYFVNPSKQTLGVELAVRVDNFQAAKNWTREPDLDILLERIRRDGRLVSYMHPTEVGGSTNAVAWGTNPNGVMLASHEQAGPALVPAGPPNNAYQLPPDSAMPTQAPQGLPMPSQSAPPPRAPTDYGLPPSNTPRSAPGRAVWERSPFPPTPAAAPPTAGRAPNAAPRNGPRNRGQHPQQYRRGAAPPGSIGNPTAAQTSPPNRGRTSPQLRMPRLPWQRPAAPQANAQQGGPPPFAPNMNGRDPRRPGLPRYSGTPAQSPPSGGRAPSRLQRLFSRPTASPPNGANPPARTAPTNYPAGLPQPPRVSAPSY
ncbi:MAG: hypothetical protein ACREQE_10200 [Candidatus Binataceae bacterium]